MSLRPDEIPSVRLAPADFIPVARARPPRWQLSRRRFLRAAVGMGVGTGMAVLHVFPTARHARAGHVGSEGYQIYNPSNDRTCDGLASGAGTCSEPCGPSKIHVSACHPDSDHKAGYHKDTGDWALRPNACDGDTGIDPNADGWRWEPGADCDGCSPAQFRCHDGWHRHAGDPPSPVTEWHKSVCAKRIVCG
jgi:hypothetical protein